MNDEILDLEPNKVNLKQITIWKRTYFILSSVLLIKIIILVLINILNQDQSSFIPSYVYHYQIGFLLVQHLGFFTALSIGQILMAFNWIKCATILLVISVGFTLLFGLKMAVYLIG